MDGIDKICISKDKAKPTIIISRDFNFTFVSVTIWRPPTTDEKHFEYIMASIDKICISKDKANPTIIIFRELSPLEY